jgi:hypothetical protein
MMECAFLLGLFLLAKTHTSPNECVCRICTCRFCTLEGQLGALDTKTGTLQWSVQVASPASSVLAVFLLTVGASALVGLSPPVPYGGQIPQVAHVDIPSASLVNVRARQNKGIGWSSTRFLSHDLWRSELPFSPPFPVPTGHIRAPQQHVLAVDVSECTSLRCVRRIPGCTGGWARQCTGDIGRVGAIRPEHNHGLGDLEHTLRVRSWGTF